MIFLHLFLFFVHYGFAYLVLDLIIHTLDWKRYRIVLFDSNHQKDDDRDYTVLNEVLDVLGYPVGTYVIKKGRWIFPEGLA